MLPDILDELIVRKAMDKCCEPLAILRRPQLGQRHRHELRAAVTVQRNRGLVHCKEAQGLLVDDPHWNGAAFEE